MKKKKKEEIYAQRQNTNFNFQCSKQTYFSSHNFADQKTEKKEEKGDEKKHFYGALLRFLIKYTNKLVDVFFFSRHSPLFIAVDKNARTDGEEYKLKEKFVRNNFKY